jgi:hypothetical protein
MSEASGREIIVFALSCFRDEWRVFLNKCKFGIIICIFLIGVISVYVTMRYMGWFGLPDPTYSIPRHVEYSFSIQNKTNRLSKDVEFWTYAPVKQTSSQQCENVEASHPFEMILDNLGNQILHFRFQHLPPYATKIITIKADLMLSITPNRILINDPKKYLSPEKFCESVDPGIVRVAVSLVDRQLMKSAENIFKWVAENVKYTGYLRQARGARYALNAKKGDCTEFMYLFAALCRANGIPTRCVGGYVVKQNAVLNPNGFHNWAEFNEKGVWRLADPQNRIFAEDHSQYIAMRIIGDSHESPMGDNNRFRLVGEGLTARMNG